MSSKVLDKDTSLAKKIRTLFREQGITIASILMAIGMAIGVLVEALPRLLGRLGVKVADVLPGFIGVIIRWIRADQNTGSTLLESPMRTAMHGKSRISSAIFVQLN